MADRQLSMFDRLEYVDDAERPAGEKSCRTCVHSSIRAERISSMTEEDAIAEGCLDMPADKLSPLEQFANIWDKTIKRDDLREFGYHADPWVWVIEFERCEKPEGWCDNWNRR